MLGHVFGINHTSKPSLDRSSDGKKSPEHASPNYDVGEMLLYVGITKTCARTLHYQNGPIGRLYPSFLRSERI